MENGGSRMTRVAIRELLSSIVASLELFGRLR